jgi:predicted ArsR family transcriptional regulator
VKKLIGLLLLTSLAAATLFTSFASRAADDAIVLRGMADCPMAAVVSHQPVLCRALESLLAEFLGAPVRACCDHGERPRCCFRVPTAA